MPVRAHPPLLRLVRRGAGLVHGLLATAVLAALIVGIPWGLVRYIGWPLPRGLPAWSEIEGTLLAPMSTGLLLHILACVLWPVWSAFVLDVARVTLDVVRNHSPAMPRPGPLNTVAAVLVGTIIMALLAQRPTAPAVAPVAAVTSSATAASAPPLRIAGPGVVAQLVPMRAKDKVRAYRTVEVEPPRDGIYDSLWRIADRTLGDGSRWPQIFSLNRGRPQPDGHTLTNPNLIRPGWVLRLPERPAGSGTHHPGEPKPDTPPPASPRPPHAGAPTRPSPSESPSTSPPSSVEPSPSGAPAAPPTGPAVSSPPRSSGEDHHQPGISLPTGAFVVIGLAALITAALAIVRRRRRVRYRPGSGERDGLAVAPVVRALRLAHDGAGSTDEPDTDSSPERHPASSGAIQPPSEHLGAVVSAQGTDLILGVRDGQALAWDLARARGLGFIGPGALDAIRALLITLLAERLHQPAAGTVEILVPAPDASALIGENLEHTSGLRIVDDLDAALEVMESELLTRTRTHSDTPAPDTDSPPGGDLLLVATPAPHADRRLQALLDNGSSLGQVGILAGQWRPGATARIRADGTVAAVSPSADKLIGARLFTLPADDARALLDLLNEAQHAHEWSPATNDPQPDGLGVVRQGPSPTPSDTDGPRPRAACTSDTPDRATTPPVPEPGQDPASKSEARSREPTAHQPPLRLAVLGPVHLTHRRGDADEVADLTGTLAPRQREVLAYLALHRHGARRETLTADLWPDAPRDRPSNAFHATLSQLRRALRVSTHGAVHDITAHHDGLYTLDSSQVTVDLWELQDALKESRNDNDEHIRHAALERVIDLYTGDLAAELTTEWTEAPREALRRDVLDAISALVHTVRDADPERALALLEHARTLDRYNEALYRDIAHLQADLGRHDAVSRTLALLRTTLHEVDEEPSPETVAVCDALQHRPAR